MPTPSNLSSLTDRIAAGTHTDADLVALSSAIKVGQISVITGERAVEITGDAKDVIIITGNNNEVKVYKADDAETIRRIVEQVIRSNRLHALITHADFVARAEQSSIVGHQATLVGRQALMTRLADLLRSEASIFVLHGVGGVGKTRLLLALADILPTDTRLWYVRTEAESIEWEINNLDPGFEHIVVVDDAHRFSHLSQLREGLVNPDLAGHVKIILVTRTVFRDTVINQLSPPGGLPPIKVKIEPLSNADIDELLANHPYSIIHEDTRRLILRIAEGNPLFAGIAARLVHQGKSLDGLNRDQVLVNYLQEVVQNLADAGYGDKYIVFIEILAALGTFDLSNFSLRERTREIIGINQIEEERMVSRLVASGLVERFWNILKVSSEVVADHILIYHFFDPTTRQADFQTQVIEPFFEFKPKEILENLSRAEIKTESVEIGTLVGQKLTEMLRIVAEGGNQNRLTILDWLEDVAYLRPDDVLAILARIIDGPEKPKEIYQDNMWGQVDVTHAMVLGKAVDLLEHTVYRGGLQAAIQYLYKLAVYKPYDREFEAVREKARKKIKELGEYKPRKPLGVQLMLLDAIRTWIEQGSEDDLSWIVEILQALLKMEYMSAETHPTERHKMVVSQGVLPTIAPLRDIRSQVISILIKLYSRVSDIRDRFTVVRALENSAPFFMPNVRISTETIDWLKPDWQKVANFYSETVIPHGELPIIEVIDDWASEKRRFGGIFPKEIGILQAQICDHEQYQRYRLLIGWHRRDPEHEDWREAEERRQTVVYKYADSISLETIDQTVEDLETIASQAHAVGENGYQYFNALLKRLGEKQPDLAARIIERTINEGLTIKRHLGAIIAGLRISAPDLFWEYIFDWLNCEDPMLWLAVADSYRYMDWAEAAADDWTVLRRLVEKDDKKVDHQILSFTWRFAPYNNELAVELLKIWAERGDETILKHIVRELDFPNDTRDGWAIEFDNTQDYLEIVQNFERLSSLDYYAENALNRLGQFDPTQVINLIEQRIENAVMRNSEIENCRAVPFGMFSAFDSIRSSPQYLDVLRRVRDWMLRPEGLYRWVTPDVLKSISGALDTSLYQVLMEWIESGDDAKIQAVAYILREFNTGTLFYNLCREIVLRTDDERILGSISAAIHTTPGVISGPTSNFPKQRLDEITPWLQDENFRVRRFGKRMVQAFQREIEREQAREAYEDKNWR